MFCDSDIQVSWRARPRGFTALMGLYESNYLRLRHLVGDPAQLRGTQRSCVVGDCELQLDVVEHMSYTSILNLTYLLPGRAPADHALFDRQPDLRLRVYHDARLLEAAESRVDHRTVSGARAVSAGERELQQRWARNMMLNKWLEYCAERGHRFRR
jgi:uncharacterized protein